jgi:adenylate kinase
VDNDHFSTFRVVGKQEVIRFFGLLPGCQSTRRDSKRRADRLTATGQNLSLVVFGFRMDHEQLLRRITGRRNCPVYWTIYNVYLSLPNREGHCDLDGAALVQQADDTESVFEEWMRTYHSSSAPVIEHYRALGPFIEMDGDRSIGGIAADIVAAVDQFQPLRRNLTETDQGRTQAKLASSSALPVPL